MSTTNEYYQCRRRSSSADTTNVRLIFETVDRVIPASEDNDDHLASSHSESSKLSKLTLDSSLSISEECMTRTKEQLTATGLDEAKEQTIDRLQSQLRAVQDELIAKNAKCDKLTQMQHLVDLELHDLTETLFTKAYEIVNEEKRHRMKAEKLLQESLMKVDVLSAQLDAFKVAMRNNSNGHQQLSIMTTTPAKQSFASRILHPTTTPSTSKQTSSTNRINIDNVDNNTSNLNMSLSISQQMACTSTGETIAQIDPIYHRELMLWRERPTFDVTTPFLARIYAEEIRPCLHFDNAKLAEEILEAIERNVLDLLSVNDDKPSVMNCSLSNVTRRCPYRVRTSPDATDWNPICSMARNRITAVCDLFTYLRYLREGLVKRGVNDAYWEIIGLRKNISMARLGWPQ